MSTHDTLTPNDLATPAHPLNADWYALRLLSNYRLFLLIGISAFFYLNPTPSSLGQSDPALFHGTLIFYLIIGVIFNHLIRIKKPDHDTLFYIQAYVDIICITILMFASGGIQSGLGFLLVANIAIIGIFTVAKYTYLFAAIATTAVLAQEIYSNIVSLTDSTSIVKTGLTGMALFAVAYITSVVIQKRYPYRPEDDKLLYRFNRIEELNTHIIEQMESGLVVVDENWRVQLMNNSAEELLGVSGIRQGKDLFEISPQLQNAFLCWKKSPLSGTKAFFNASNERDLLPHFSSLGRGSTLINLEDASLIAQQVQQLKLASLGSLTASIAHEIRNPLSAIKSSIQLVAENHRLEEEDLHMLDIAERHCSRINRIVEDILQLSRHEKNNPSIIDLNDYLPQFVARFKEQFFTQETGFSVKTSAPVKIAFDASHLEQIISNLCSNAITHNTMQDDLTITLSCELDSQLNRVSLVISDNGKGISKTIKDEIFEPFYTTEHNGSGLGLFIVRELCEINNARITLSEDSKGATFRITTNVETE